MPQPVIIVGCIALLVYAMPAVTAQPLAPYRWENRVLLVYAPSADDAALATFRTRLAEHACGVADRDLISGEVVASGRSTLNGEPLTKDAAAALRAMHGIAADDVMTILVGKDGGAKMRTTGVVDLGDVFTRIDGMPMRQREMAERQAPDCG